jgi:hypothetical protein
MAALVIRAIDQETARARRAHFAECRVVALAIGIRITVTLNKRAGRVPRQGTAQPLSDTHQLQFAMRMGFAKSSTHPTNYGNQSSGAGPHQPGK